MKQLVKYIRSGESRVLDVPPPQVGQGQVLVRVASSVVSVGTERMVIDFARKNLLQKARARPDLMLQVMEKIRRDGIAAALKAANNRLDQPLALGYSCSGTVVDVDSGISDLPIGTRVACAGGGHACHAEVISVPRNLIAVLPTAVDFESAAFTTIGAVAIQGIRLANVQLGDTVGIIGLGLVGQLSVQILKAAGCSVVGIDYAADRAELARVCGADIVATQPSNFKELCLQVSGGHGVDAVLITADTVSDQPIELAGEVARDKGRVIAVGAVGMKLPRRLYYSKELDFKVSRSYGPGRYDPCYEEKGIDYPYGYVRWTANRNMCAFINLLRNKKLNVSALITHRFPIAEAVRAYDLISPNANGAAKEPFLGVVLQYPTEGDHGTARIFIRADSKRVSHPVAQTRVGVLGAGNFALNILLPILSRTGVELVGISSGKGLLARHAADKFGFQYCTGDWKEVVSDPTIDMIVVATRHHLHAEQIIAAIRAGKHVFAEKPLCVNRTQLAHIVSEYQQSQDSQDRANSPPSVMVGYNRRFAGMAVRLRKFFAETPEPLMMDYRVNAGFIPLEHWTQDPHEGGGRVVGEVCHFIDFLVFVTESVPVRIYATVLPDRGRYNGDNVTVTIDFENGSIGTIRYLANGDRALGKERIEISAGGRSAVLEDFRKLAVVSDGRRRCERTFWWPDKGHRSEWISFLDSIRSGSPSPIPFEQILVGMEATFGVNDALRLSEPVRLITLA